MFMKHRVAYSALSVVAMALVLAVGFAGPSARADTLTGALSLPPGFSIDVFAHAPGARSMVVAEELNVLFVSTRGDTIYAIPLSDDDGLHPTYPVLTGLKVANGIAWRDGHLYVAEQHRLVRYFVPSLDVLPSATPEVLFDELPDKPGHGWRYLAFGPALGSPSPSGLAPQVEALYMGIGAPCNVCTPQGLEGAIARFRAPRFDTPEVVASGVRNSVGFDVQPNSGVLYFNDNGADGMGDDSPPEEMNALPPGNLAGRHYGFPWYGGGQHRTPQMRLTQAPDTTFPEITFQAHAAPLGLDFYSGQQFPQAYQGDAFVAQHGSWNRSSKVGYQVVRVRFDPAGKALGYEPFITGWLRADGSVIGRPVDLEELPDGSLLVSDDKAGRIYRVTYKSP
jgi:glucose/arabinose dehydrogenase